MELNRVVCIVTMKHLQKANCNKIKYNRKKVR